MAHLSEKARIRADQERKLKELTANPKPKYNQVVTETVTTPAPKPSANITAPNVRSPRKEPEIQGYAQSTEGKKQKALDLVYDAKHSNSADQVTKLLDEATDIFAELLVLAPSDSEIFYGWGEAYEIQAKHNQRESKELLTNAVDMYNTAVNTNNNFQPAKDALARVKRALNS